jgi:hypothetical protein
MIEFALRLTPLFFLLLLLAGGPQAQASPEDAGEIYEINFGADPASGRFITALELEAWARNQNLLLVPDRPFRELRDGVAAAIPPEGLYFELDAPGPGRNYLYLDFATYRPLVNPNLPRVRWIEVIINGETAATLYQGGGAYLKSPEVVIIEREHAMDGKVRVWLRPSPGDGMFAIWDAFVSRYREDPARLAPDDV